MATTSGVCHNDPNFAVICSFLDRYSELLALPNISYAELESWIEDTKRVNPNLIDLHIRMLRRTGKKSCLNVTVDRWERALVKFCHTYSDVDAWEIERFSYKYCKISTKLKLLKNLLECQFDTNIKFKDKVNELLPEDMRVLPIGRDKNGLAYWYMLDKSLNLRIYREDQDDVDSETWELVCRDRDDLARLIENLEKGDTIKLEKSDMSDGSMKSEPVSDFNEDSRDSVIRSRSCTPIKPSPLTFRSEYTEEEDNDLHSEQKSGKLTLRLKVPKLELDSPRKRLKDKFEKEKGQQIKNKKKCKIKDELHNEASESSESDDNEIDQDSHCIDNSKVVVDQSGQDDKKEESLKTDEVDGLGEGTKDAEIVKVKKEMHLVDLKETTSKSDRNLTDADENKGEKDNSTKNEDTETALSKEGDSIKSNDEIVSKEIPKPTDVEEFPHATQNDKKTVIENIEETLKRNLETEKTEALSSNSEKGDLDISNNDACIKSDTKADASDKNRSISNNDFHDEVPVQNDKLRNDDESQDIEESTNHTDMMLGKHFKGDETESIVKTNSKALSSEKEGVTNVMANDQGLVTNSENLQESKYDAEPCSDSNKTLEKESDLTSCTDKTVKESIEKSENELRDDLGKQSLKAENLQDQKQSEFDSQQPAINEKQNEEKLDQTEQEMPGNVNGKTTNKNHDADETSQILETDTSRSDSLESQKKESHSQTLSSEAELKLIDGKTVEDDGEQSASYGKMSSVNDNENKDKQNIDSEVSDNSEDKTMRSAEAVANSEQESRDHTERNKSKAINDTSEDLDCNKEIEEVCEDVKHDEIKDKTVTDIPNCSGEKESKSCDRVDADLTNDQKGDKGISNNDSENVAKVEQTDSGDNSKQKESHNAGLQHKENSSKVETVNEHEQESKKTSEAKSLNEEKETTGVSNENQSTVKIEKSAESPNLTDQTSSPKRQTKVAVRKLTKKSPEKISETPEKGGKSEKEEDSDKESSSDSSEDDSSSSSDSSEDVPLTRMKGLLAHSRLNKGKALKRQAEDSFDESPVEPASKRSKVRGRVTSKTRSKQQAHESESSDSTESSSDSEDLPLSQISTKKGAVSKGAKKAPPLKKQVKPQPTRKSSRPVKKKVISSDEDFKTKAKPKGGKSTASKPPEDKDSNQSEEDDGRRRSARVRSMRARKKEPSPEYIPSELEDIASDFDTDDEFVIKSKRRKKKMAIFEEEEPKGKNAKRLEAKSKSKTSKKVEEEPEDETPCCKCLKSNQPEWILLCDKCDSGYHTACLRPPLMIIPPGDWFCPPCEHTMLIEKLQENLVSLDQNLLKSDRLVRRKERLAYVGISLDNIIKEEKKEDVDEDMESESVSSESDSDKSSSESESSEVSSEPRYPRRQKERRQRRRERRREKKIHKAKIRQSYIKRTCRSRNPISYKFEEYDELIMDAIQEDMSIPKEPKPKKVKPPGISRGKDMSNILGVSDEETKPSKAAKKRRPRLTELDDTEGDDDDTDDYQVSGASSATDVSQESESLAESGSDFSDEMYGRRRQRGMRTRRSKRRRRGCSRFDDFVVESDYDSEEEEDLGRRSTRKSARKPVNYRELNSDESEVKADDNDDSFHSSDASSDYGKKKKGRGKLRSKSERSKRDKKRKHGESSEEWTEESDSDSRPSSKKKEKRLGRKKKFESDEESSYSDSSESSDTQRRKPGKNEKKKMDSESEEVEDASKVKGKKKKANVIESESESGSEKKVNEGEKEDAGEHTSDSEKAEEQEVDDAHDDGSDTEVSEGDWEEIDINSGSDKGDKLKSPKRKASPTRGDMSPNKGASSPKKKSPVKRDVSPKKDSSSIKKDSAVPEQIIACQNQVPEQEKEQMSKEMEDSELTQEVDKTSAEPKQITKNIRKRKSTESSESIAEAPINSPTEPGSKVVEMNEHVGAKMEPARDICINPIELGTQKSITNVTGALDAAVIGMPSGNMLQGDNVNRLNTQQNVSHSMEGQGFTHESMPDTAPIKKKRTRRTKAQMEEFRKVEEEMIQHMIAQGIPEEIARKKRQSKKARTQSMEELQVEFAALRSNVAPQGRDFLLEEPLPVPPSMIDNNERKLSTESFMGVTSDGQNRALVSKIMEPNLISNVQSDEKFIPNMSSEEKSIDVVKDKPDGSEIDSEKTPTETQNDDSVSETIIKQEPEKVPEAKASDERKDDSPLSVRRDFNNAPVGIVKPEVRQGVIVENRQVMESMRGPVGPGGRPMSGNIVSPLQGMKDMTMGKVPEQGGFSPPNMPPGYQNRGNTEGFRQPNYPGFPPQQGPYGPSQPQPYQQGMPHRPYPYNDQQGPLSPNAPPPSSQYMPPNIPPGSQPFYPGPYRSSLGPGMEGPQSPPAGYMGYGNQNYPHQGPYGQGFHSPTGPYPGQVQGPGPYPEPQSPVQGPHQGPSAQMNYPPNMPSSYSHVPQSHHPSHGMQYPQNAPPLSPTQPIRPQPHPASRSGPSQSESPTIRPPMMGVPPRSRRGFMMDNILKPTSSGGRDEDNGDEINDIVNYVANDEYFKEH